VRLEERKGLRELEVDERPTAGSHAEISGTVHDDEGRGVRVADAPEGTPPCSAEAAGARGQSTSFRATKRAAS